MPVFYIDNDFYFKGRVYRTNEAGTATLEIGPEELRNELKKGTHPKTKKPLSPILNHCTPADNAALEFVDPAAFKEKMEKMDALRENSSKGPAPDPDAEEVEKLRADIRALGKDYDRRWGLDRLKSELKKYQIETGN